MIYLVFLQLDKEVAKNLEELTLRNICNDEHGCKEREDLKTFLRSCGGSDYVLNITMHLLTLNHLKDAFDKCSITDLSSLFNCPLYITLQIKNRLEGLGDVSSTIRTETPKNSKFKPTEAAAATSRKYK